MQAWEEPGDEATKIQYDVYYMCHHDLMFIISTHNCRGLLEGSVVVCDLLFTMCIQMVTTVHLYDCQE